MQDHALKWLRRGIFYGEFTKRIPLPQGLKMEDINAHYVDGILELTIPVSKELRPKKIDVEVGGRKDVLTR